MEKKLCFGCFSDQHIVKNCKEWQTCKTCKRQHPRSLHDYDWAKKTSYNSANKSGAEPSVSSNRTAICNVMEAGDVPINMGILPVYLFHKSDPAKKIKVYALGIEGNETDLILTMIHGTSSVTTKAVEVLVVANIKEEDVNLDLPRTFTRHVIPADRNEIPQPDVICKMSVNIGDKLKYELEYEDIKDYYWTDNKVVLGFISNESRRFHTYIANRVQLIHEHTIPSQWHYVETALNTADKGSRDMSPKDFVEKSEWIGGPDCLKKPIESWLKEKSYDDHVDSDSPEVKNVKVNISAVKESSDILKRLRRFSGWFKAKMAVALCLKYKRRLRDRVLAKRKVSSGVASDEEHAERKDVNCTPVNVADLKEAEMEIIKHVQRNALPSEIKSLQDIKEKVVCGSRKSDKEKKALIKKASSLRMLDPVVDSDSVVRVGGRIRKANLPRTLKNPVILPKSSHISSLIIRHVHEKTHRSGRGITLNELRSCGYWLVSRNAMVQTVYF